MSSRTRAWAFVHRWTSLVCTLFLLMLCLTGLPLIFHEEIDALTEPASVAAAQAQARPQGAMDMDEVVALVGRQYPARRIQFVTWLEEAGQYRVGLTRPPHAQGVKPFVIVDGKAGAILGEAWSEKDWRNGGPMSLLLKLHTDMLMGLPGALFLGFMGLLFTAALVSGVVLYGPFMRKLPFGTVRAERSRALKWLDLHNLLGIATVCWALVVGLTGVINTLDSLVFGAWQKSVNARLGLVHGAPPPTDTPRSLQQAVDVARRSLPSHEVSFVAFPGSMFTSSRHYAVYMRGATPLTARLLHPVLIDAATGELTDAGGPPWYLWALEGSRPLHFGDYGGLPMKILWALLDLVLIVVLASGLYLWARRHLPLRRGRRAAKAPAWPPSPAVSPRRLKGLYLRMRCSKDKAP